MDIKNKSTSFSEVSIQGIDVYLSFKFKTTDFENITINTKKSLFTERLDIVTES